MSCYSVVLLEPKSEFNEETPTHIQHFYYLHVLQPAGQMYIVHSLYPSYIARTAQKMDFQTYIHYRILPPRSVTVRYWIRLCSCVWRENLENSNSLYRVRKGLYFSMQIHEENKQFEEKIKRRNGVFGSLD